MACQQHGRRIVPLLSVAPRDFDRLASGYRYAQAALLVDPYYCDGDTVIHIVIIAVVYTRNGEGSTAIWSLTDA